MIPRHKATPEEHLTWYVVNHYGYLMTKTEWLANRAFMVRAEIEHGYSPELIGDLDTNEAEALALMKDGPQLFWDRVRERIVRQHSDLVTLTCCPKCRGLARTPRAAAVPKVLPPLALTWAVALCYALGG